MVNRQKVLHIQNHCRRTNLVYIVHVLSKTKKWAPHAPQLRIDDARFSLHNAGPVVALDLLSSLQGSSQSSPSFVDIADAAGLTAEGQHHAVAVGDYDNDGDEDIYVGSKFAPNALYRNNGNMTFTEVGAEAGGRRGLHQRCNLV